MRTKIRYELRTIVTLSSILCNDATVGVATIMARFGLVDLSSRKWSNEGAILLSRKDRIVNAAARQRRAHEKSEDGTEPARDRHSCRSP